MIETTKTPRKIKLSSMFDVDAEESRFKFNAVQTGERIKLTLSDNIDKKILILNLLRAYERDGDLSSIRASEKTKGLLEKALKESTNYIIEEKLKNCVFTFWRNGTTFLVLKMLEGLHEDMIIKFARPGKDFERDIAEGYKTAKIGLGASCSTPMTLVDINLRVRDADGIDRVVFLKNVLVQKRVIVLKDILDILKGKKDLIKNQYRVKKVPNSVIQNDPEIKKIRYEESKIKSDFDRLYKNFIFRNIEDKDEGPLAMDRNYGYRVPVLVARDYGFSDFQALRKNAAEMNIVGFDFDSIRPKKKNIEIKTDRVPDVFSADIKVAWKELLEKILVKRA